MARPKKSPIRVLADYALKKTSNGEVVVDFLIDVMNGEVPGSTPRDQLEAAKVLLERGFGKSPLTVEVSGQVNHVFSVPGFDPSRLSDGELADLEARLARAQVLELGDGSEPAPVEEPEDAEVVAEVVREDRPWRRRALETEDDS